MSGVASNIHACCAVECHAPMQPQPAAQKKIRDFPKVIEGMADLELANASLGNTHYWNSR
ncbi:hypothetical protein [Cupriavidus sp. UME77]|uniref:hypothetical protein n=1 Tax=Cupriavidus sp. UME77 TaxID=1862321 RepID=UPI00160363FB|nr:hypothetical protein [Cupriavidus sp. UME77]